MAQLVADESVDFRIVRTLRDRGLSVLSIAEGAPSVSDREVLKIAVDNQALLLTEDKDFGELVFRFQLTHSGILLLRVDKEQLSLSMIANTIATRLPELLGKFAVISNNKLRIKG